MSKEKNGGAAFPIPETDNYHPSFGMSLRDYFAAKAMQGMITNEKYITDENKGSIYDSVLCEAYKYADAALRARED